MEGAQACMVYANCEDRVPEDNVDDEGYGPEGAPSRV